MSNVKMTVQQICDLELWDKVCEYKGWNPYILREGQIVYSEVVEFDSEFKKEECEIKKVDKSEYGVHQSHCCALHGCKCGEKDCPVVNGEIQQKYTCEICDNEGIESIDELKQKINQPKILDSEEKQLLNDLCEAFTTLIPLAGRLDDRYDHFYIDLKERVLKYKKRL